jgi:hypothetical protein
MGPPRSVNNDVPRAYREFVTIQVHQAMSRNDNVDFLVIQAVGVASDISGRRNGNEVNEVAADSIRSLNGSMSVNRGGTAMSNFRFKRERLEEEVSWCGFGQLAIPTREIILGVSLDSVQPDDPMGWRDWRLVDASPEWALFRGACC